jgi:hypothetical protein
VGAQDNRIPDFNPQQELEQFMQTIGNDFKDFNTFGIVGGKRPARQPPTNGFFGGASQLRPSVTSFNADRAPPPTPFRNNKATQVKRRGDYSAAPNGGGGGGGPPTGQVSPAVKPARDRITSFKELGYRNKANRRGDGFAETVDGSAVAVPFGGEETATKGGNDDEKRVAGGSETEDPGHKYESIPLDGVGKQEEEEPHVVNYGYHPIIDFFNSQNYR